MTIMTRTRPAVKPTRVAPRRDAKFAEGLEEQGLCCPIDQRPLPTIQGVGLTFEESRRVNGARNRAFAEYASSCPEATLIECEVVARKAATDELRRALMARPAAPALKAADERAEEPAAPEVVEAARARRWVPTHQGRASVPAPMSRKPKHTAEDERWWSERHIAREMGLAPVCGGQDEAEEPEESEYHRWLYQCAPVTVADLSDDRNGAFFVGEMLY